MENYERGRGATIELRSKLYCDLNNIRVRCFVLSGAPLANVVRYLSDRAVIVALPYAIANRIVMRQRCSPARKMLFDGEIEFRASAK